MYVICYMETKVTYPKKGRAKPKTSQKLATSSSFVYKTEEEAITEAKRKLEGTYASMSYTIHKIEETPITTVSKKLVIEKT